MEREHRAPCQLGLRQALAIAIVKRRRERDEVGELRSKIARLESDIEALRAGVQPGFSADPLDALAERCSLREQQPLTGGVPATMLAENALLWARAAQVLGPGQAALLADTQLYLQHKDAAAAAAAASDGERSGIFTALPPASSLERTPAQAMLELATDALDRLTPPAGQPDEAEGRPAAQPTGAAHGLCLRAAVHCLLELAAQPGATVGEMDSICIQHFAAHLLQLAVPPAGAGPAAQPGAVPAASSAPADGGEPVPDIDLSRPLAEVAQQLLTVLLGSASTGLLALVAAAAVTQQSIQDLAAHATGTTPAGARTGAPVGVADADAAERQLGTAASALCAALQRLPGWGSDGAPLDEALLRQVADSVVAATDESRLLSLSHPGAACAMQAASSRLMAALHRLSLMQPAPGA